MPQAREIEMFLNEGTLKDLVIEYLHRVTVIRNNEEVTNLVIAPPVNGACKLTVRFEPDIQTIY